MNSGNAVQLFVEKHHKNNKMKLDVAGSYERRDEDLEVG